jgi:prolycopene isomerase
MAEKVYPGLREHILVMEAATPLTAQRYTLNKNGCYVGFDLRHKRLPQRTPINDLYLAGAWTEPHGGVLGVILSGKQAAEMIIDEHFTTAAC